MGRGPHKLGAALRTARKLAAGSRAGSPGGWGYRAVWPQSWVSGRRLDDSWGHRALSSAVTGAVLPKPLGCRTPVPGVLVGHFGLSAPAPKYFRPLYSNIDYFVRFLGFLRPILGILLSPAGPRGTSRTSVSVTIVFFDSQNYVYGM